MKILELLNSAWKKLFTNDKHTDINQIINSYRYGSFLITSIFYLLNSSLSVIPYKIIVIISLYLVLKIITGLYHLNTNNSISLKTIILLETILSTILLIPTGGLNSPFIWYALNPVLVAACYISTMFSWLNLLFYMSSSLLVSASIFSKGKLSALLIDYSYLMLVFILITLLVHELSTLLKQLQSVNLKQSETIKHVMSLYTTIETFNKEDNPETYFQAFTDYVNTLTKAKKAFFWVNPDFNKHSIYTTGPIGKKLKDGISEHLLANMDELIISDYFNLNIEARNFSSVVVKSSTKFYGVIGVALQKDHSVFEVPLKTIMFFLADLCSIFLERFSLEEVHDRLILLEERNRIADEIHDSVSQLLFSINCSLHLLKNNWNKADQQEIIEQLNLVSSSAQLAMSELRSSIYGLSTKKNGEKIFFSSIKTFLDNLAKLNNIEINTELVGNEELLTAQFKKCLYRIICEAVGNALKHGNSKIIDVNLDIRNEDTKLLIVDKGRGFDQNKLDKTNSGLGIANIKNIVHSLGGNFILQSQKNVGTVVLIKIPITYNKIQKQGGVL